MDTVEEHKELVAAVKALKCILIKYLSLDHRPLCGRIKTKVSSLMLEHHECCKNLEDVNKALVEITTAKE